jgi:signal transduction histidine kinase
MELAISKSIVESHRARIWADGEGGSGATSIFTLPAAPTETTLQWTFESARLDINR